MKLTDTYRDRQGNMQFVFRDGKLHPMTKKEFRHSKILELASMINDINPKDVHTLTLVDGREIEYEQLAPGGVVKIKQGSKPLSGAGLEPGVHEIAKVPNGKIFVTKEGVIKKVEGLDGALVVPVAPLKQY